MFLTAEDLKALTGKRYGPAQCRVLDKLRIPYIPADGRPRVLRSSVEAAAGVKTAEPRILFERM